MSGSEALLGVPMHVRDSSRREASDNVASVHRSADFERLALPLLPSLYNHASWLTRNHAEAEDLVQETFSKALRAFDSFEASTNFKAWMIRILRNTFLTSRTGIATSRTVFLEDHPHVLDTTDAGPTPEDHLIRLDNQAALQRALEQLERAIARSSAFVRRGRGEVQRHRPDPRYPHRNRNVTHFSRPPCTAPTVAAQLGESQ